MKKNSRKIIIEDSRYIPDLFGIHDENLKKIESVFDVRIVARENIVNIHGNHEHVITVENLFNQIISLFKEGFSLQNGAFRFIIKLFKENGKVNVKKIFKERVKISLEDRYVTPKSIVQKEYVYAIRNVDIVLGIGPAGTGKTYLAMALGISGLIHKRFSRIILARPAVEAGEKLGYLPGDLYEKINPYLRPLYDALYDMMDIKKAEKLIEDGSIEIAPLAYMRGRTLNESFIILDEAQNSTSEQMKMFLTRMGLDSKIVITGDITQIDLPDGKNSGLIEVQQILKDVIGVEFIYFSERDVVRHELVQKIIKAYERYEK